MVRSAALALSLSLLAACGSKQSAPAPGSNSEPAKAVEPAKPGEHGEHEMAGMPAELKSFHDVLAPRWHAEPGAQRMQSTCAAMADFHAQADALAKVAAPPGATADAWMGGIRFLVGAVSELDAACKANDAATFETAFKRVHEIFHGLLAVGGGEEHHEAGHGEP